VRSAGEHFKQRLVVPIQVEGDEKDNVRWNWTFVANGAILEVINFRPLFISYGVSFPPRQSAVRLSAVSTLTTTTSCVAST